MVINKVVGKLRFDKKTKDISSRKNDLINFVGEQFKQLVKKNLGLPVKLYQL